MATSAAATGQGATYDDRVIAAARQVFAEQGFAAPMSEVARRAEVGVASIYRRYESKQELAEAVRIAGSRMILAEAEAARAETDAPWDAFVRFLYRCLRADTGIGTVLPPKDDEHAHSEEFVRIQALSHEAVEALVVAAQRAGELREDFGTADVFLLFKHLNPELAVREHRRAELRARYLGLVVEGLRPSGPALSGPAPDRAELLAMCENPHRP